MSSAVTTNGNSPMLAIRDVTVRYGGVVAVDGVTFDVAEGDVVGLIGPNGAGKTSLMDALCGYSPCSGEIHFLGRPLQGMRVFDRSRLGLGRTFQSMELYDDLTVEQNVLIGADTRDRWRLVKELVRGGRTATPAHVDELMAMFDLGPVADRRASELPQGQRKLVMLARALAGRPKMLLLDEPAAGLDQREREHLGRQLERCHSFGVTMLMVEHDMSLVTTICRDVHVLDFGRLIASGSTTTVMSDPAVVAAYLGVDETDEHDVKTLEAQ